MKKVILSIFIFLSIISMNIREVKAENIDITRESSLEVTFQYDNLFFSDADVSLYYLAGLDSSFNYNFKENYQSVSFNPNGISASELTLQAEKIENFIKEEQIPADQVLVTDQSGNAKFNSLLPGLYLVIVNDKIVDNYQYEVSPTIINIPTVEEGIYQYDVQISLKTERNQVKEEVTPPSDNNQDITKVPNTIDNISLYVTLLVISLVIIIGVIVYLFFKRKGERKCK